MSLCFLLLGVVQFQFEQVNIIEMLSCVGVANDFRTGSSCSVGTSCPKAGSFFMKGKEDCLIGFPSLVFFVLHHVINLVEKWVTAWLAIPPTRKRTSK